MTYVEPLRAIRGFLNAGNAKRSVRQQEHQGRFIYLVPSETTPGAIYDTFVDENGQWVCSPCPDFAETGEWCKHIVEVLHRFYPSLAPAPDPKLLREIIQGGEKTWYENARRRPVVPFAYESGLAESTRKDQALEEEDERIEALAADVARKLNRKHPATGVGRHGLPVGDRVAMMLIRKQHGKSMRKFKSTMKRLAADGVIAFTVGRTAQVQYNTSAETTELLLETFEIVARTFTLMEQHVIADATGMSPFYVSNWRDSNYGERNFRVGTMWFKEHVIVGRRSKAILAFAITPHRGQGSSDDANLVPMLLNLRERGFDLLDTTIADNIYLTAENIAKCKAMGVRLVGPLKPKNFDKKTGLPRKAVADIAAFKKSYPAAFDELTSARQAVEGVFSCQKREDNHVAAIGTEAEREMQRYFVEKAELATTADESDELKDVAAQAGLYVSRLNEFLVRVILQVMRRTVALEKLYNRRISYVEESKFSHVRDLSDEADAA